MTRLIDYEAFCGEAPLVSSPAMFGRVPEVSVEDLKTMRDRGDRVVLVDVREAHEWPDLGPPGLGQDPSRDAPAEPEQAL